MSEPLVRMTAVSKQFPVPDGQVAPVLSDISCIVTEGQHVALIGPSGSGKSTLLHIMAGLIAPSSGSVDWPALGPRDALMPSRLQVVFQMESLFPALDALENIALPMILAGQDAEPRAQAMLDRFGLTELAHKLPEELSGGQAQRTAMARALAIGPALILADEPTGQLDQATARRFLDQVIEAAAESGTTLVIATHDPQIALRMQSVWTIDHGRLAHTLNRSAD